MMTKDRDNGLCYFVVTNGRNDSDVECRGIEVSSKGTKVMRKIDAIEARPARYTGEAEARRLNDLRNAYAMSVLEGAPESPMMDQLFRLLASGRITEVEYLRFCRTPPHSW